jgi:hypothetical protein
MRSTVSMVPRPVVMSKTSIKTKVKISLVLTRPLFVRDPAAGGGNRSTGGDQEGEH